MKNDTRSSQLTLVNSDNAALAAEELVQHKLLAFAIVSISCTVAAVVSGSYAIWLLRKQAAFDAVSDVEDILENCRARMHKLEKDVSQFSKLG